MQQLCRGLSGLLQSMRLACTTLLSKLEVWILQQAC